jgi:hypothetical protein
MSVSQHPIALRLERRVGEGTRLLATVMALPLVDGIFPALVLAGAVSSALGILEVGLLIFGGSATLAVVLAEMEGSRRQQLRAILGVGAVLLPLAAVEAALAPTIQNLVDLAVFERFAALVVLAVAAKTASATVGEYLPSPGAIVGLGLIASAQPAQLTRANPEFVADPMLVASGVAAAGVGVSFALAVALLAPWLRGGVDLDRFRFGSAVALGVLALSIVAPEVVPANAPVALAVLAVTAVLAFDPGSATAGPSDGGGDGRDGDSGPEPVEQAAEAPPAGPTYDGQPMVAGDGGSQPVRAASGPSPSPTHRSPSASAADSEAGGEDADDDGSREDGSSGDGTGTPGISDGDRAPWL